MYVHVHVPCSVLLHGLFDCISSISVTSGSITKSDVPEEMKFDWTNMMKGDEIEMHSLLLMDQSSFEGSVTIISCDYYVVILLREILNPFCIFSLSVQHVYQLCPQEHVMSMCSCNLMSENNDAGAGEGRQVFVIGTALVKPEDKEPSFGRILVFQVDGGIDIL